MPHPRSGIDSDAIFTNFNAKLEPLAGASHADLIISPACVNAGVFFLRVSKWSLSFASQVIDGARAAATARQRLGGAPPSVPAALSRGRRSRGSSPGIPSHKRSCIRRVRHASVHGERG